MCGKVRRCISLILQFSPSRSPASDGHSSRQPRTSASVSRSGDEPLQSLAAQTSVTIIPTFKNLSLVPDRHRDLQHNSIAIVCIICILQHVTKKSNVESQSVTEGTGVESLT